MLGGYEIGPNSNIYKATGDTMREQIYSMKDVKGFDPNLDNEIDIFVTAFGYEVFCTVELEIDEYDSWNEWFNDYNYALQYFSDNPNHNITIEKLHEMFHENKDVNEDPIDRSKVGVEVACPECLGEVNELAGEHNKEIFECKKCGIFKSMDISGIQIMVKLQ